MGRASLAFSSYPWARSLWFCPVPVTRVDAVLPHHVQTQWYRARVVEGRLTVSGSHAGEFHRNGGARRRSRFRHHHGPSPVQEGPVPIEPVIGKGRGHRRIDVEPEPIDECVELPVVDLVQCPPGLHVSANVQPGIQLGVPGPDGRQDCLVPQVQQRGYLVVRVEGSPRDAGDRLLNCRPGSGRDDTSLPPKASGKRSPYTPGVSLDQSCHTHSWSPALPPGPTMARGRTTMSPPTMARSPT